MTRNAYLSIEVTSRLKRIQLCALIAAAVAGCGGGNEVSGSGGGNANTPPPVERLSQFIGTWTSACDHQSKDTIVITRTPGTTDSINSVTSTEYFSSANCTGPVIATSTDTGTVTSKFVATVDSSLVFSPGASAVTAKVDQVTTTVTQSQTVLAGSSIVHHQLNGISSACVTSGGLDVVCVSDAVRPAQSGISDQLILQGTTMYDFELNKGVYELERQFTKKTG